MEIISILISVLLISALITIPLYRITKHNNDYVEQQFSIKDIEYSEKVLDHIQMIATKTSVIRFDIFRDTTNNLEKINKTVVANLISSIANECNDAINWNMIDVNTTINRKYYDSYLILIVSNTIKKLLNDEISQQRKLTNYE